MRFNIGNTSLVQNRSLVNGKTTVWAKCEYENPTGSHKDRAYLAMIEDLEAVNRLITPPQKRL